MQRQHRAATRVHSTAVLSVLGIAELVLNAQRAISETIVPLNSISLRPFSITLSISRWSLFWSRRPEKRKQSAFENHINQIRQEMGIVFQQFNLFPHLTVLQNIMIGPMKLKGLAKAEALDRANTLLAKVGLADKGNAYPSRLSGGQKQRVAIARALAMQPKPCCSMKQGRPSIRSSWRK